MMVNIELENCGKYCRIQFDNGEATVARVGNISDTDYKGRELFPTRPEDIPGLMDVATAEEISLVRKILS